jgi:hypothetical protein
MFFNKKLIHSAHDDTKCKFPPLIIVSNRLPFSLRRGFRASGSKTTRYEIINASR